MVEIVCPHCGHAKTMASEKIPPRQKTAVCPKCREPFPLASVGDSGGLSGDGFDILDAAPPAQFFKSFYFSRTMRRIVNLMSLAVILMALLVPVLTWQRVCSKNPEAMYAIIPLVLVVIVAFVMLAWLYAQPVVEITDRTFTMMPALLRSRFNIMRAFYARFHQFRWDDVVGYDISRNDATSIRSIFIRFYLKSDGPVTNERVARLAMVDGMDEVVTLIARFSPTNDAGSVALRREMTSPHTGEVSFGKWHATEQGLSGPQGHIVWNKVSAIDYPPFVIGGFGGITVSHTSAGFRERFSIRPKASVAYQDFVRFVVYHAGKARVAPGAIKMLRYPVAETRLEFLSIILLVTGILLLIATSYAVDYFSEDNFRRIIYIFLPSILALGPGIMLLKTLVGRFQGELVPGKKKVTWALLFNLSQPASLVVIALLSTFFMNYLSGFVHDRLGNAREAEQHYLAAWDEHQENVCVAFDLALLYRKQEKHALAYEYFEKAYQGDPEYWSGLAIGLIPDSLAQMGDIEGALERVDELIEENRSRKNIVRALQQKRTELANRI